MEIQGFNFPEDLYYDNDHIWSRKEEALIVIGMDDFGQKLAGDIVFIQLPKPGKKITKGKKIGKLESGKWVGQIVSPVDGELVAVNEALESDPGLVSRDCYGEGWMYKVKPADMSPLEELRHTVEALEAWMKGEIVKYEDKL